MNDERLPFKLLTNHWDKVKCKSRPRRSWLAQVESLNKEKAFDKRECEEFEMALKHKPKLRVL